MTDPRKPAPMTAIERERLVLREQAQADSDKLRKTGFVAIAAGMLLIGIIGAVAWLTVPIILADGESIDGVRFAGGRSVALLVLAIYAIVAAFGLSAMVNGAYHVVTGRRSALGIRITLAFGLLLLLAGMLVKMWA